MPLTAQNIIDATSVDLRSVLGTSGGDELIILEYVDRIHKDCMHSSIYSHLNQGVKSQVLTAGTETYALTLTDLRRILNVYDRTFNRPLLPMDVFNAPASLSDASVPAPGRVPSDAGQPKAMLVDKMNSLWPEYYRLSDADDLYVFPAPATAAFAGTLEIHYEKQVVTLTAVGDSLIIPEDAKDMVVAGVNYLTSQFLKRTEDAKLWFEVYDKLKRGEHIL